MSDTVPTVTVKGQDGQPLIMNLSDFDQGRDEIFIENSFDRKTIMSFLDSKGIKYPKNVADDKLQKFYEEAKTELSIVEKDGKFMINDGQANQIGAELYTTEKEAEEMLKSFTGK